MTELADQSALTLMPIVAEADITNPGVPRINANRDFMTVPPGEKGVRPIEEMVDFDTSLPIYNARPFSVHHGTGLY
jgi:hypothetical protein